MATKAQAPGARELFLDERGAGLRVSWHPERELVVLSLWHGDVCTGSFRLPIQDTPRLSAQLAVALGDWAAAQGPPPLTEPDPAAEPDPVVAWLAGLRRRLRRVIAAGVSPK